jgi:hypothetical protein
LEQSSQGCAHIEDQSLTDGSNMPLQHIPNFESGFQESKGDYLGVLGHPGCWASMHSGWWVVFLMKSWESVDSAKYCDAEAKPQGCVIAPLLFNVFFDCVVRLSLAEMPEGCGVRLAFRAEREVLPWHARAGGPSTMLTIAALMYADDLVLMSCDRDELELMLKVFDSVCSRMGMCVNAAKTALMAVCHHGQPLESVQLSGSEARYVPSFKYLGGVVDTSASWAAEGPVC